MPKDQKEEKANLGGAPKDGIFAPTDTNASDMGNLDPTPMDEPVESAPEQLGDITKKVADKIKACENILITLSKDPNVDEIAAAIGLSMILNQLGKHVTAIYSGETPNTLEFLRPEETFEKDTNSLQDFIIALNKDKADHLRYKIEGDYVKVYITPYKTTITDKDLEFSQGDFNVDLVISIDVDSGETLDAALSEYGRIMHDATAINITTNAAGHFAELEWSDPSMSSCSEMIALLAGELGYSEFDQPVATALLTGIVSATDRFSNARTTSETMALSSKLMQAGADQQLISSNIMKPEVAEKPAVEEVVAQSAPEPVQPAPEAPVAPASVQPAEVPAAAPVGVEMPAPVAAPVAEEVSPVEEVNPAAAAAPAVTAEEPEVDEMIPGDQPLIPEPTLAVPVAPTASEASENPAPEMAVPVAPAVPIAPEAPVAPAPASDTFALPGQPAPEAPVMPAVPEVPTAPEVPVNPVVPEVPVNPVVPEAPVNPTIPEAPATPQIISQGSVIQQNVAEPVAEEPDYGSMIDQALAETLTQNPTANPAMTAAPTVSAQATEPATIPNLQYIDPEATPASMMSSDNVNLPPAPAPNVDTTTFDVPKE